MRLLKQILMAIMLYTLSVSCVWAQEVIRLTNGEWPPFLSPDMKHYGFSSHVITEAFALVGVKVEWGFFPWQRSYTLAQKGVWDGSAIWARSKGRAEDFYFSDPVLVVKDVFFHRKDFDFTWESFDDLENLKIGATVGYVYGNEFEEAEKSGKIKVDRVVTDESNLKKLLAKRLDIFVCNFEVGYSLITKIFPPSQRALFTNHLKAIRTDDLRLLFSKKGEKSKEYLEKFNRGLEMLHKSGRYEEMEMDLIMGHYEQ